MCNLLHTNTRTHFLFGKVLRFKVTVLSPAVFLQTTFLKSAKCTSANSLAPKKWPLPEEELSLDEKGIWKWWDWNFYWEARSVGKRMKKVRWSKQEKWKKRKQLYKTTLSIGGCRITAIQDLMTGKSVHVFLHGTKNWKYDFQCRHFTSKQSKVNAPWYLGELGWVDLNPLLLMMQIYLNWATHFLTSSSLNPSRLQIPPYSFPMSIYIFDAK